MHFAVLVIGDDVEKKLAPYQQNNMDDCPKEYLKYCVYDKNWNKHWFDTEEDFKKSWIIPEDEDWGYRENPNAQRDWYEEGGRFAWSIELIDSPSQKYKSPKGSESILFMMMWNVPDYKGNETNSALIKDVKNLGELLAYAYIDNDWSWHENQNDGLWKEQFREKLKSLDWETRITIIDYHI